LNILDFQTLWGFITPVREWPIIAQSIKPLRFSGLRCSCQPAFHIKALIGQAGFRAYINGDQSMEVISAV
jgi:hypothetical protein